MVFAGFSDKANRDIALRVRRDPRRLLWRTAPADWAAGGVGTLVFGWYGIYNIQVGIVFLGILFLGISLGTVALVILRPYCAVDDEYLVVQNPIRLYVVPLSEIRDLDPSYDGTRVERVDGRAFSILCLQKWNIDLFLRRRARADIAAGAIRARMRGDSRPKEM
jgi:hypothetical protein